MWQWIRIYKQILMNREIKSEEPVQHRTIYFKEEDDISEGIKINNSKNTNYWRASEDNDNIKDFVKQKTSLKGVDRIVKLGSMNL